MALQLDWLWTCPQILRLVSKDKQSSLLGLVVSDKGKKFYNIDTWWVIEPYYDFNDNYVELSQL